MVLGVVKGFLAPLEEGVEAVLLLILKSEGFDKAA